MASPSQINFETRPCKYAERRMLLYSFSKITDYFQQEYQYIGFGGLSFTDFKLFHKELSIESLFSIEASYSKAKLDFNKPFSCVEVKIGRSTEALATINLTKPSIIWLDYDDALTMTCFQDISLAIAEIPHGSILVMSCNRQLQMKDDNGNNMTMSKSDLCKKFNGLVPEEELDDSCCEGLNAPKTIRKMIERHCQKTIIDRNLLNDEKVKFTPLYNIIYEDGARMFTFGGAVLKESFNINDIKFNDLGFMMTDEPYHIKMPNVTYRESLYLNQNMNDEEKENYLVDNKILDRECIDRYKKVYKYLPSFYDVRL